MNFVPGPFTENRLVSRTGGRQPSESKTSAMTAVPACRRGSNSKLTLYPLGSLTTSTRRGSLFGSTFATRFRKGRYFDVHAAVLWQAKVYGHHILRTIPASAIDEAASPHRASARRVNPHFRSGPGGMTFMIDDHNLQRPSRPLRRQHVFVEIMRAAGIIVRDRQVERAVAVEVDPLNPVGRAMFDKLGRERVGEAVTIVVEQVVLFVHGLFDVRKRLFVP